MMDYGVLSDFSEQFLEFIYWANGYSGSYDIDVGNFPREEGKKHTLI